MNLLLDRLVNSVQPLMLVYSYFTLIYTVPAQSHVTVGTTTATSIPLSWTSAGSEVDSYEVVWTADECPDDVDEGSAIITETSYIIEGLREGTSYTIIVSATNSAGTSPSDSVTGETEELGTLMCVQCIVNVLCIFYFQLQLLLPLL